MDKIDGSIKSGIEITNTISSQRRCVQILFIKTISPMKKKEADTKSSAGLLGIELTQITPFRKKGMAKDFHKLSRKVIKTEPSYPRSIGVNRESAR